MRGIIRLVNRPLAALVIDDETQIRTLVAQILGMEGWEVSEASTADEAYSFLDSQPWRLVFCDVVLGGPDGYQILRRFTQEQPGARFVLMTGHGSAAGALDATAIGAYDYLVKPFTIDDVYRIAQEVKEQHELARRSADEPEAESSTGYLSDVPLIGRSPKFVECLKLVGRVSGTNLPVLISGDSGTGKEVIARAIHKRSPRAGGSFVTVNCGAIPLELIESELFGHVRGSFTGADRERMGLWEEADGGTIFLDEITETSPLFQVKLLRALQEGEIRRVGSNKNIKVDVRVLAATNRDISTEVESGRFRQDLMYRLNAVSIDVPSLKDRKDDILLLAQHFAKKVRGDAAAPTFSQAAVDLLEGYSWEGNVRELENAIFHAASLCDDVIYPDHLPMRVRTHSSNLQKGESLPEYIEPSSAEMTDAGGSWRTLADVEHDYVVKVLDHTGGNKQAAARILNIDRKTLSRIVSKGAISDQT